MMEMLTKLNNKTIQSKIGYLMNLEKWFLGWLKFMHQWREWMDGCGPWVDTFPLKWTERMELGNGNLE